MQGSLGQGSVGITSFLPVLIPSLNDILFVLGTSDLFSGTSYAVTRSGDIYCWGFLQGSGLGDPPPSSISIPLKHPTLHVKMVSSGGGTMITLTSNDRVFVSGSNNQGNLGLGGTSFEYVPVSNPNLNSFYKTTHISSAYSYTYFVTTRNQLFTCGRSSGGSGGISPSGIDLTSAVQMGGISGEVKSLHPGILHLIVLHHDGKVFGFGDTLQANLFTPGITPRFDPDTPLPSFSQYSLALPEPIKDVATSTSMILFLTNSGKVYINTPLRALSTPPIVKLCACPYHALLLANDGYFWSYGLNSAGSLGLNHTNTTSTPEMSRFVTNVSALACGETFSAVLDVFGDVWTFGSGDSGVLGLNHSQVSFPPKNPLPKRIQTLSGIV